MLSLMSLKFLFLTCNRCHFFVYFPSCTWSFPQSSTVGPAERVKEIKNKDINLVSLSLSPSLLFSLALSLGRSDSAPLSFLKYPLLVAHGCWPSFHHHGPNKVTQFWSPDCLFSWICKWLVDLQKSHRTAVFQLDPSPSVICSDPGKWASCCWQWTYLRSGRVVCAFAL